jgi:predicted DCC family thiol-disulfide oxidoreductase YuxK
MKPQNRPVLIYDGDCNFCRRWIVRLRHVIGDRIDYRAFQEVAHPFPDISREQFQASIQLVQPDGSACEGAEAVFQALAYNPNHGGFLWMYRRVPGVASATEFLYRLVARNRRVFGRLQDGS